MRITMLAAALVPHHPHACHEVDLDVPCMFWLTFWPCIDDFSSMNAESAAVATIS
jgi:hypothetical protein